MLGRAALGGLLFGGVGAIVGGATAEKETTYTIKDNPIFHNYTVCINVNDLSSPEIIIKTEDLALANKILALTNAVIANK